jgi:hypothetical protein
MRDLLGDSNTFMFGPDPVFKQIQAGEGLLDFSVDSESGQLFLADFTAPPVRTTPFKFGRMFRMANLPEFRPELEGLIELGLEMTAAVVTEDHPDLPAGYTYLGQFVDHDITFDKTVGFPDGILSIANVVQGRSPSLDLDSLYGLGPVDESNHPEGRVIYQPDGVKLREGTTDPDFSLGFWENFSNDLPRGDDPNHPEKASLADERNDENLAVAQTHLAFIKFHNKVVDLIKEDRVKRSLSQKGLFEEARSEVVRHYQWIILHDFLPRIVEGNVLKRVLGRGCKHFHPEPGDQFVPFEFSVAAFRFGHSLVRETYEWNKFFHAKAPAGGNGGVADLSELFQRTGFKGQTLGGGHLRLPSTWIINWTNFFDFKGFPGQVKNPNLNFAKRIDPSLSAALAKMRMHTRVSDELAAVLARMGLDKRNLSLATLNLLRGWLVGVPTGQSVLARLRDKAPTGQTVKRLTSDQIAKEHGQSLRSNGLHLLTPLWYYVLREAKEFHGGKRLGPVGSHIVAEAFVGLIKSSTTSILRKDKPTDKDWVPHLGPVRSNRFDMPDLLFFVNELNPLGA